MFETIYETDIISRKNGNSVKCIYSGTDYEEAYSIADEYNRENLADYDEDLGYGEYYDGKSLGYYADVFSCDCEENVNGIGKFEEK